MPDISPNPWIPVVLTIVFGIAGFGVQGLLFAYFLGRMKAQQEAQKDLVDTLKDFTSKALDGLNQRMSKVDTFTAEASSERAGVSARLKNVESKVEGLPLFREEFVAFSAHTKAHQERIEADLKRTSDGVESLQRQVANLAFHGPGQLVKLPETKL